MINEVLVSVIMPVYNCELYVKDAVLSILNQTFTNFEFIIIDDKSTDETLNIIKSFVDTRIKLIEKPVNTGYTNSLNLGLSIAKGKYIARMDGDDISMPLRFEKQIGFLENNPEVILCGSCFKILGTDKIISVPEWHDSIKVGMLLKNQIAHPTVMLRSSIIQENHLNYNINKEPAEDFDLWCQILKFGRLHNLNEILLEYRMHKNQVSKTRSFKQKTVAVDLRISLLNQIYTFENTSDKLLYTNILQLSDDLTYDNYKQFIDLKNKLIPANDNNFFNKVLFNQVIIDLELNLVKKIVLHSKKYKPIMIELILKSRMISRQIVSPTSVIKFFVKCLLSFHKK